MALRLSTGLINSILGNASLMGTDLAYVDGGASPDTITDASSRFITAGFKVGDAYTVAGFASPSSDLTSAITLTGVLAGTLTFITGTVPSSKAFEAASIITGDNGGSWKELFDYGVCEIYDGTQPATADLAQTGSLLCIISKDGATFTPGSTTNGLRWRQVISGVLSKNADTWKGTATADGTAGWARDYDTQMTKGASTNAVRFDMDISTANTQFMLSNVNVVTGAPITVDTCIFTQPSA